MAAKKRAPVLKATVYGLQNKRTKKWAPNAIGPDVSFANAFFWNGRPDIYPNEYKVVPCRVRVLPSARKATKRTR